MWKTLINVLIDDIGLIQNQIALYQDRDLTIRVHHRNIFGLIKEIDIADLKIHTLLKENEAAAL
jgi:hypothetical protein